jgi:hypothetical protein
MLFSAPEWLLVGAVALIRTATATTITTPRRPGRARRFC